jgi:hypothetical protein
MGGLAAMDSRDGNSADRQRELEHEIERFRAATTAALGQLEWMVSYFYIVEKPEVASALNRNRKQIIEDIRDLL